MGELVFQEDALVARIGRPRATDSDARRIEFLRLVFDGVDCKEAARRARIKPDRALEILTPLIQPLLTRAA